MKFHIARQPLIPAFLTLVLLVAVTLWGADATCSDTRRSAHPTVGEDSAVTVESSAPSTPSLHPDSNRTANTARHRTTDTTGTRTAAYAGAHPTDTTARHRTADTTGTRTAAYAGANPTDTTARHRTADTTGTRPVAYAEAHPTDTTARHRTTDTTGTRPVAYAGAHPTDTTARHRTTDGIGISRDRDGGHTAETVAAETVAAETVDYRSQMAIPLPNQVLADFQTDNPRLAKILAALLLLFAGICIGRTSVRYNLYAVSSCLAIPLYGIATCCLTSGCDFLTASTASALLALALKNFARSFRNGYEFDRIFRASLYLGLLPLVTTAAAPLLLLMPLALILFRRTSREAVVATVGLLLPFLACCYINWGAGGSFIAPLAVQASHFAAGQFFQLFRTLPLASLILLGTFTGLVLFALGLFLSNFYAAGTKPRFILVFDFCAFALSLALLLSPSATHGDLALAAVPAALALPILFVRTGRSVAAALYALLLAATVAQAMLQ